MEGATGRVTVAVSFPVPANSSAQRIEEAKKTALGGADQEEEGEGEGAGGRKQKNHPKVSVGEGSVAEVGGVFGEGLWSLEHMAFPTLPAAQRDTPSVAHGDLVVPIPGSS